MCYKINFKTLLLCFSILLLVTHQQSLRTAFIFFPPPISLFPSVSPSIPIFLYFHTETDQQTNKVFFFFFLGIKKAIKCKRRMNMIDRKIELTDQNRPNRRWSVGEEEGLGRCQFRKISNRHCFSKNSKKKTD